MGMITWVAWRWAPVMAAEEGLKARTHNAKGERVLPRRNLRGERFFMVLGDLEAPPDKSDAQELARRKFGYADAQVQSRVSFEIERPTRERLESERVARVREAEALERAKAKLQERATKAGRRPKWQAA